MKESKLLSVVIPVFQNAKNLPHLHKEIIQFIKDVNDIDMVVPHQANYRITETVQKHLGVDQDKVFSNIHNYGNTTAASIGIALTEALDQKKIKKGDIVVLASFGAGFQWGSVVIKW